MECRIMPCRRSARYHSWSQRKQHGWLGHEIRNNRHKDASKQAIYSPCLRGWRKLGNKSPVLNDSVSGSFTRHPSVHKESKLKL